MNYVSARDPDAETIALARNIVKQHEFPPQVTGFDVALDEFDGGPILSITFYVTGGWIADERERVEDADILTNLVRRVRSNLLQVIPDRFPHFWFSTAPTGPAPTSPAPT